MVVPTNVAVRTFFCSQVIFAGMSGRMLADALRAATELCKDI